MPECIKCQEHEEKIRTLEAEKERWKMAVYTAIYHMGKPDIGDDPSLNHILEGWKALMEAFKPSDY